jgi:hypothetical protein
MWSYIAIAILTVAAAIWLPAIGFALVRLGIREYFKQKRIYLLEMMSEGMPEDAKEHK